MFTKPSIMGYNLLSNKLIKWKWHHQNNRRINNIFP